MTTVSNTALSDLGLAVKQTRDAKKQLGQDDFLKLMTTQLQYQDPFKPMDNAAFLGQIAQFSTVSGIDSLNTSFGSLSSSLQSNQSLQAAGMVGHGVLVPSASAYLQDGNSVTGAAELPVSGQGIVEISDKSGQIVRHIDLGTQPAGLAYFNWDGRDDSGAAMAEGQYTLNARLVNGSSTQAASTLVIGQVNSVSVGSDGITLNLLGMSPAAFSAVRQIF